MKFKTAALAFGATAIALGAASAASAQEFSVGGSFGVFSDYRLRGVSLSDETPAIQGSYEAGLKFSDSFSIFGGAWMSSLYDDGGVFGALETDIYAGAKGAIGDLGWKATYLRLIYVDHSDQDFDQFAAEVSYPFGPISAGLGVVYDDYGAPGSSTYIWTSGSYTFPEAPVTIKATLGTEDGAFYDKKTNYGLGVTYAFDNFSLGAEYIDSSEDVFGPTGKEIGDGTVVVSISSAF